MSKIMYADPGVTAIYQVNDGVIANPLSDINNVFFHSDFDYLRVLDKRTVNVSLPATGANVTNRWTFHAAFAHGLPYKPTIAAYINTINAPIVGTFLYSIDEGSSGVSRQDFYSASDSTNVGLFYGRQTKPASGFGGFTLNVTFFVFGEI